MLWKIYFWFLAIFTVVSIALKGISKQFILFSGVDLIFTIFSLIALFGYAYKNRYLKPLFWKVYWPFIIVWDFIIVGSHTMSLNNKYPSILYLFSFLVAMVPFIPLYIAIYKYAYTDSKLTITQLNFRKQMKGIKKIYSPLDTTREGNPFYRNK